MDYLNELLTIYAGRRNDGTYRRAMALKRRGDAVIFNNLAREWMSRFRWKVSGDGNAIAPELIERSILFDGMAAFKRVSKDELFCHQFFTFDKETDVPEWRLFRVSGSDNLSFYGYPNRATLTDFTGKVYGSCLVKQEGESIEEIDKKSCVIAQDSTLFMTPILFVLYYAEKLSMIETSINACIQNITGTSIITCSKEQEKQILKERKAAKVGVPWVVRYDEIYKSGEGVQLLSAPGSAEELKTLYEAQNKVHADFLQGIGIRANNEVDKRTGVNPLELIQSRQNVDIILNDALEMRKKAVRQLNEMGLSGISVDLDNFEALIADYDANGNRIDEPIKTTEGKEGEPQNVS